MRNRRRSIFARNLPHEFLPEQPTRRSAPAIRHRYQRMRAGPRAPGHLSGTIIEDDVRRERLGSSSPRSTAGYQINKIIRESCVFARHDVTRDPPFSHLDLVSCRNRADLSRPRSQRRVLPMFHYALNPTGLLMLGSAETTAARRPNCSLLVDKAAPYLRAESRPLRDCLSRWHWRASGFDIAGSAASGQAAGALRTAQEARARHSEQILARRGGGRC